jgi:hypothetical protein
MPPDLLPVTELAGKFKFNMELNLVGLLPLNLNLSASHMARRVGRDSGSSLEFAASLLQVKLPLARARPQATSLSHEGRGMQAHLSKSSWPAGVSGPGGRHHDDS